MPIDTNIVLTGPEDDDDDIGDILPDVQPEIVDDNPVTEDAPLAGPEEQTPKPTKREQRKKEREERSELRNVLREYRQDEERRARREIKERKAAAQSNIREIRADAVGQRIQAYSLAASTGFPGYVAASVIDRLLIQPTVDQEVTEQQEYLKQLELYRQQVEDAQIANRREDRQRTRPSISPNTPATLPQPLPAGPNQTPPPPTAGPPPTTPTPPPGGTTPVPIPPPPPPRAPYAGAGLATAGALVTGGIFAARAVNQGISSAAQSAQSAANQVISGTPTQGLRQGAKDTQKLIDPLGTNIPLNVIVQGFDILLSTNEAIRQSLDRDIAFSPETLQQSITADLNLLLRRIDNAQRLDPVTAELVRVNGQLDLAWEELRAELIENIGPAIVTLLRQATDVLNLINSGIDLSTNALPNIVAGLRVTSPSLAAMIDLLGKIADNTAPGLGDDPVGADVFDQINRFFDPVLAVGRAPPGSLPPEPNP